MSVFRRAVAVAVAVAVLGPRVPAARAESPPAQSTQPPGSPLSADAPAASPSAASAPVNQAEAAPVAESPDSGASLTPSVAPADSATSVPAAPRIGAAQLNAEHSERPNYSSVVTATRDAAPLHSVASTISVITARDLEERQLLGIADALRELPGLQIVRTGGLGGTTSLFTRGTNANHTLVLVDGVRVADPSTFTGAVDLADLSTDAVERLEVLRGPASSLYGSGALGGVVSIVTREGRGPLKLRARLEGGSLSTFHALGNASGSVGPATYSMTVSRLASAGISHAATATATATATAATAAASQNANSEPDGYGRTVVMGRVGLRAGEQVKANLMARYTLADQSLDDFKARPIDDPNYTQQSEELLVRPELQLSYFSGRWRQTIGASYSHHSRKLDNLPDLANPADTLSRYLGRRAHAEWQHQLILFEHNQAMALLEAEWDWAKTHAVRGVSSNPVVTGLDWTSARTLSAALQDQHRFFDAVTVIGSARIDAHSVFGTAGTYAVGAVATLPWTKTLVRASYKIGFKAPSLLQLRDATYGNADLEPERSRSVEAGLEQPIIAIGTTVGATVFQSSIDDLISYEPATLKSINVARARISGIESFVEGRWELGALGVLRARADYTYMEPKDLAAGTDLVRRPRHKAGFGLTYLPVERASINVRVSAVGFRSDRDFTQLPMALVRLAPYVLVAVAVRYEIRSGVSVFGRVENLLDQKYEEALGFGTPGLTASAGLGIEL